MVPVHNSANYIRQTIESLLTQTLYGLEIILVENGSTDNTLEILKEYEGRDWRIQLHSIGASDAGTARNYGLERAHGQYIIFLDADDIFYPTMIAKAYNAGVKDDAEVIWFKTAYKDLLSGQTNPYNNFFNVAQMPNHRPLALNNLNGTLTKLLMVGHGTKCLKRIMFGLIISHSNLSQLQMMATLLIWQWQMPNVLRRSMKFFNFISSVMVIISHSASMMKTTAMIMI